MARLIILHDCCCHRRYIKLHYNHRYDFLRPTIAEVVDLYKKKFHSSETRAAAANVRHSDKRAAPAAAASADAPAAAPSAADSS